MRNAGPTERRVRAALIRLFERCGEDQFSWPSDEVRDEVLRDGEGGDAWKMLDVVQRWGRRCTKLGDIGLEDGLACTYSRGTFTLRRRASEREHPPKIADDSEAMRHLMGTRPGHLRTFGFLTVDRTGDSVELRSIPEGNVPKVLREWADRTNSASAARERLLADHDPNPPSHLVAKVMLPPEPRVTQRHLDLMRHATGGALYFERNRYAAAPYSEEDRLWSELAGMGLAALGTGGDGAAFADCTNVTYHVSDAGFRMVYGDVRTARERAER